MDVASCATFDGVREITGAVIEAAHAESGADVEWGHPEDMLADLDDLPDSPAVAAARAALEAEARWLATPRQCAGCDARLLPTDMCAAQTGTRRSGWPRETAPIYCSRCADTISQRASYPE